MEWDWIKITGLKDLPAFNRTVLLFEEKDGKEYAAVGFLKSIDADGYHWKISPNNDFNDLFGLIINNKNEFNPTHWCEIQPPKKEKK